MGIRQTYRNLARKKRLEQCRLRLTNHEVTILSSNCVGGVIYHDLGLRFMSPTINLFMRPTDFVRFLSDVPHYLNCGLQEIATNETYPCGDLDGLRLDFVHYGSFAEAKAKWDERSSRVNLNNCCAIMVDRDGCTREDAMAFDSLPIDQKAFLSARHMDGIRCEIVNPEWIEDVESPRGGVRDLCAFKGPVSAARWLDSFDYMKFLNGAGGIRE